MLSILSKIGIMQTPMKSIFLLAITVFLFMSLGFSQVAFAQTRDTLWINKSSMISQYKSNGVQGFLLKLDHRLTYQGSKTANPASWNIAIEVEDEHGFPVRAIQQTMRYQSPDGDCAFDIDKIRRKNHTDAFIPFYALDLPAGEHKLQLRVSATLQDSVDGPLKYVDVVGKDLFAFSIIKPKTHRIQAFVKEVRVSEKNRKGKVWDSAFFNNGSAPDVKFALVLASAEVRDYVFVSTQHKNSFSGSWSDYSSEVMFSEGDEVILRVYDNDGFLNRDDTIGDKRFTLYQMISHTNRNVPISFDKVTFCDVSFRVVE